MRIAVMLLVTTLALACGSGGGGIGLSVAGRVLRADGSGVAGATVTCPAGRKAVVTGPDGAFELHATVPEPVGGGPARAALWFEASGMAPVVKSVLAGGGDVAVVVAVLDQAVRRETVALPARPERKVVFLDHGKVTIGADSFTGAGDAPATGTIDLVTATWDPTYSDALEAPVLPVHTANGGGEPYLEHLFALYFRAEQGAERLSVGDGGVGLDLVTTEFIRDELGPDDGRAFRVDPLTGELVEKPVASFLREQDTLLVEADGDGTWVWARERAGDTTCVDVQVVGLDGLPARSVHVLLYEKKVTGGDASLLDERAGTPVVGFCMRAPTGLPPGRLEVWFAGPGGVERRSVAVSLSGTGTCASPCPNSVAVDLREPPER